MRITGGVASTLNGPAVTVPVLPATSMTDRVLVWLAPSPSAMGEGQGPASPERLSPQVKLMVGRPVAALYQPVAAGLAGLTAAVIVGGVVSTLMPEIVAAVLTLPAMSVTVRETDWFGLSFKV